MRDNLTILQGNNLETLATVASESVQCCVTSPPYFGLRSYLAEDHPLKAFEIGSEKTPAEFVAKMVSVFREVKRVLKNDGTCWINLGDSYAGGGNGGGGSFAKDGIRCGEPGTDKNKATRLGNRGASDGLKPKDLIGIPWRVAFALQEDGWFLRCDIIWNKPNPMPESVTDRPTKPHEYIFLLTKSARYFYDAEAIKEEVSPNTHARVSQNLAAQVGSFRANGGNKTNGPMRAVVAGSSRKIAKEGQGKRNESYEAAMSLPVLSRNKRSVWTVGSAPYKEAHFATFPPDLIKPCILAGSRAGDTVLDPFGGSGTVGEVSLQYGRKAILCELNPDYCPLIRQRCDVTPGFQL